MSGASQRWWSQFLGGGDVITGQKATLPRIFTGPVQIEKMGVVWQTMSVCLAMFDLWIQRISKMSLSKSEYRRSHLILHTNMISTWKNDFIFIPLGGRSHPIPIQPYPLIHHGATSIPDLFSSKLQCVSPVSRCSGSGQCVWEVPVWLRKFFLWDWRAAYFIGSPALIS